MSRDDTVFMEAYEKLLDSWMALITEEDKFPAGILAKYGRPVFDAYVQCHLSPPEGCRLQVSS